MKKYLSRLSLFCLVLLAVLSVIDYAYSSIIRKSNYRPVEAWENVVSGKVNADIVVLGSSRAWVQFDPDIIDSVLCVDSYNLGIDGSQINRQVQKYNIYRKRNPRPKVILQNIDFMSLSYIIGYEKEQFFPYFWDGEMRRMFFPTEPFSFGEKYIPFYRYHGMKPMEFIHRTPLTLNKGYQGQEAKWDGESFRQREKIEFTVNDTTARMFDEFLQQTKEEGIKVVFVYSPIYYGATLKTTNIDEMHETYQAYADKYGIPILDYTDMWICHDTTYFYNAMHLNKTGAEIFSDSLANDLKALGYGDFINR